MKRQVLKEPVENTLIVITAMLFMCLMSVADFSWNALPLLIGATLIIHFNLKVLDKYGRHHD